MSAIHRRHMLRGLLASSVALPVASLISDPAKSALPTFGPGFNLDEASDLLYMCDRLYLQPDGVPKPAGFDSRWGSAPIFVPPLFPGGTLWALWMTNTFPATFAIIVRGTVLTFESVFEDLLSFLIPATGSFTVAGTTVSYKFAADTAASIHAGFALGSLLLLKTPLLGILAQLTTRVPAGSNIYIAGHSQGAAVSCLLNSYLYYAAQSLPAYSYKTYSFAQPKPGNDHYETDFGSLFSNKGLAFRLTNSLDFIPQLPFTWELPTDLNIKIPLTNPPVAGGLDGLTPTVPPRLRGLASFESLNAVRSQTIQSVYEASKVRLQGQARAVAQTQNPYVAAGPFTISLVDSLYFVAAATEMALIGTPCATPTQCKDLLWQHHTTTYYSLMQAQLTQAQLNSKAKP